MKLVWFEVKGYKRFATHEKVNLNEKLVAIVGPNEAGKTSLLRCLLHFNNDDAFVDSGGSQEISRGVEIADDDKVAEWSFALDADDRVALADVPEANDVRWYSIEKRKNGKKYYDLKPMPKRSLELRQQTATQLTVCIGRITAENEATKAGEPELLEELKKLAKGLASQSDDLSKSVLDQMLSAVKSLDDTPFRELAGSVEQLHSHESVKSPSEHTASILSDREPKFLFFSSEDRNLKSEYDLNQFFKEEDAKKGITRQSIPTSLQNLAHATNLDLNLLHTSQANDDRGKVKTILERAEGQITKLIQDSWTQSRLSISLELDGFRLQVLLRSEEGEYVKVVERSDGLRQFVALLLFLARQPPSECKPILLIDEAESRLHYDAQADLVQVLAKQDLASKVIYTTHSIGCLPEDLGSGIRMVAADDPYSKIENYFWNSKRPGFSPLLFSMGTQTLAFLPMRYAVIAEGAADLILLPALLKGALGVEHLGFQVVPGLSSGDSSEIAILDNESARTAYLTDGDSAGRRMRKKIKEAGVAESMMLCLPSIDGEESVIEDYVPADSYLAALSEELKRSGCDANISETDISRPNRPKNLERWCKANNARIPSKRAVAYQLVENQFDKPIVDERLVPLLSELYGQVRIALGI